MPRMRIVGWEVRPIVMADDGENLTPIPVNPQTIAPAGWQAFKDGGDTTALEQIRAQVETLEQLTPGPSKPDPLDAP